VASQFQLAHLQLWRRVEEFFAFLTNALSAVPRLTGRVIPSHSLAVLPTGLFSLQVLDHLRAFTGNRVTKLSRHPLRYDPVRQNGLALLYTYCYRR
jgi:hypothetical protein